MRLRSFVTAFACLLTMSATVNAKHHTARFFTSIGAPRTVEEIAFSPDGNRLALAVTGGPVVILDTATGDIEREIKFDPFLIRFSANGRQILAVSTNATKFLDPRSGTASDVKWKMPLGYAGCVLKQKSGKLLIDSLTENSPAAAAGTIQIGDELLALIVDGREISTLGKSEVEVMKMMTGPVGTPIALRILPKGSGKSVVVELRMKPATKDGDRLVFREYGAASSPQTCIFGTGANLGLLDANSGEILSVIHPIECTINGRHTQSRDGRLLAVASMRAKVPRGQPEIGLEIFDVDRQERTDFVPLDTAAIDEMRFSPDGLQVLIGGYDRILVYDLKAKKLMEPILVGFDPKTVAEPSKPRDSAANAVVEATRRQIGLGLSGRSRIQAPGPIMTSFDVSGDGTFVAVGGMHGNCTLWSVKEHRRLAEIGEPLKEVELTKEVTLSEDGRWVAYFAKGTLNIASVKEAIANDDAAQPEESADK